MSLFAWANRQLEQLTDKLAPVPNDPAHRFSKACSSNDGQFALQLLSSLPPPLPDGTHCSPLDPFSTIINKQKGSFAIHCAAEYAQVHVVKALIAQFGVSPEQFDQQGNTPLHHAAASQYPQAFELVKMLVKEYNVSATVQNMNGQTPYDLAKIDSIRQFLLPIQLQSETQKCIDNGGKGLPEGIDMGGLVIKRDLPPPPVVGGGFGSPPAAGGTVGGGPGNIHNFSAASMKSASKYAVPVYGHQPQQGIGTNRDSNATFPPIENHSHAMQSPYHASLTNAADAHAIVSPSIGGTFHANSSTNATNVSSPPIALSTGTLPPVAAEIQENANMQLGDSAEKLAPSAIDQSSITTSENAQVPVMNVDASNLHPTPSTIASQTVTHASFPNPMPDTTPNSSNSMVQQQQVETDSAPSSGSGYARRGYSSAAVLPTNAKYKPDGFHSSSSDVSLQRKYGHDPSISGPPSGTFRTSMIAPPPSATVPVLPTGSNPYSATSAYGVSPAMARPRYPTYDAVADTVGAAPGGHSGYNYNPYAMSQMSGVQFNMYNPAPSAYPQSSMQQNVYGENNHQVTSSTPWKTATAPDGRIYYYNEITNESTWEMPSEMLPQQTQSVYGPACPVNQVNSMQSTEPTSSTEQVLAHQLETQTVENSSVTGNDIIKAASTKVMDNLETCNTSTQSFFGASMSEVSALKTYEPVDSASGKSTEPSFGALDDIDPKVDVAVVNDQLKDLNVTSFMSQQTAPRSATELFDTPTNTPPTASKDCLNSGAHESEPTAEITSHAELVSIDGIGIICSSPAHTTQDKSAEVEKDILLDDYLLPQPPFVVDGTNEDDDYIDDDLPPPPMIDISL
mmetsp:Transcript_7860/g.14813  ORF Transcript_7860/g.14813 Transcript_7860/m.14813 type:complete len:849 (+) Transcript_7860:469-3015(+)